MKKTLNEDDIHNELKGASSFFRKEENGDDRGLEPEVQQDEPKKRTPRPILQTSEQAAPSTIASQQLTEDTTDVTVVPRHHDTMIPRYPDEFIESIRKAVKQLGKEAATYRFTAEEKKTLADLVYTYKNMGIRTSENEITRTAINFLLEDYQQNGASSILAVVLERLNS